MRVLQREIEAIEEKIKKIIQESAHMRRRDELGRLKRNEAVALVGLAPF